MEMIFQYRYHEAIFSEDINHGKAALAYYSDSQSHDELSCSAELLRLFLNHMIFMNDFARLFPLTAIHHEMIARVARSPRQLSADLRLRGCSSLI